MNRKQHTLVSIIVGVVLVCSSIGDAYQVVSDFFIFPVVARVPGAGGTNWVTEVCVGNPQTRNLVITGCLTTTGGVVGCGQFVLPATTETCVADVIGYLGLQGSGTLWLETRPEDNPDANRRGFVATAMVYNNDPSGRFGQDIPGVTIGTQYGVLFDGDQALIPGLHNYGSAGFEGARSNVGFVNLSDHNARVDLFLYDFQGHLVWQKTLTLAPYELYQRNVPASGFTYSMGIRSSGEAVVAYGSVVDNKSGDGVLRPTFLATGFMPTPSSIPPDEDDQVAPAKKSTILRDLVGAVFEEGTTE